MIVRPFVLTPCLVLLQAEAVLARDIEAPAGIGTALLARDDSVEALTGKTPVGGADAASGAGGGPGTGGTSGDPGGIHR